MPTLSAGLGGASAMAPALLDGVRGSSLATRKHYRGHCWIEKLLSGGGCGMKASPNWV
jgi:hypothetical protein